MWSCQECLLPGACSVSLRELFSKHCAFMSKQLLVASCTARKAKLCDSGYVLISLSLFNYYCYVGLLFACPFSRLHPRHPAWIERIVMVMRMRLTKLKFCVECLRERKEWMNESKNKKIVVEESTVEHLFWSMSSLSVVVVGWALRVLEKISFFGSLIILEGNEEWAKILIIVTFWLFVVLS